MAETIPYTYLIGWPEHNRYYYGVRYANGCSPEDLWNPYTTSSQSVYEFVKAHGTPTLKQIRQTFQSVDIARSWENRVLKKMQVVVKEQWLNKTDNKSITPMYGTDNPASNNDVKLKISRSVKQWYQKNPNPRLGAITPPEVIEKQSRAKQGSLNPFYGKSHTEENIKLFSQKQQGINNSFYKKTHSEESKQRISNSNKGKIKPTSQCPHCDKIGGINAMPRWHFDNCKELKHDSRRI